MGRPYNDPEVKKIAERVSYTIKSSPDGPEDEVRVELGGRMYEPKEISAMILKKLKDDAELRLGEAVDSAVITVPAYFSERQKNATREAGLLAGLKVKKIIDEPTAAAIAYGMDQQDDEDRMVLVFDLGGGTFDVSILLMVGGHLQPDGQRRRHVAGRGRLRPHDHGPGGGPDRTGKRIVRPGPEPGLHARPPAQGQGGQGNPVIPGIQ